MKADQYNQYIKMTTDWLIDNGPDILIAIIIFILGRFLARWCTTLIKKTLNTTGIDTTLSRFLCNTIYYALLTTVILASADQLGIKTTSFIAILGAAGLAVGLALKDSLSNFASGIMLIFFQPFKTGDAVTCGDVTGKVDQINIFSTILLTFDNKKIIIPNNSITNNVITNISAMPTRRIDLVIGISYDDDIIKVKNLLKEIIQSDNRILEEPATTIAVSELGDSSVNLIIYPWVKTADYGPVRFYLLEKIKLEFDQEGISFPYPQQDVHLYKKNQNL